MKSLINNKKGITLIALIITIILLLIIAIVTIKSLNNTDMVDIAQGAKNDFESIQEKEDLRSKVLNWQLIQINGDPTLKSYLEKDYGEDSVQENEDGSVTVTVASGNRYVLTEDSEATLLDEIVEEPQKLRTIAEVQGQVISQTQNTVLKDEYGNKILLPAGFKVTSDASKVTEGIVIEDCTEAETKGSQFVWIPVGKVYYSKTEYKTINLDRYSFAEDGTATARGTASIDGYEERATTPNAGITVAKEIEVFKTKAKTSGGYYLGRYEARNCGGYASTNKTYSVYNSVTQINAANLSRTMYNSSKFTSDLVNSYAWDTALVFAQAFDNRTNKSTPYSRQSSLNKGSIAQTGTNIDIICNIHDMASNCFEWTTEVIMPRADAVQRGDSYPDDGITRFSSTRDWDTGPTTYAFRTFRPIIYLTK